MSGNVQKIAVMASSTSKSDSFCDDGRALGDILAGQGMTVILPGDLDSIKGDVMIGALHNEGNVVNVYSDPGSSPFVPHPPNTNDDLIERVIVEGRKGVKKSLDTRADVAVLMQGGLEELDQAMHLARRGTPLIVVNESGFYNGLKEQLDTLKESRLMHNFPGNRVEHVHVVDSVEEVVPIIDLYNAMGTPEYDYAQRWSKDKAEDRFVRRDRTDEAPGFSRRAHENKLADDAGIVALAQASQALVEDKNIPMVIDNSTGYYDGLLAQLDNYVDEGIETIKSIPVIHVTQNGRPVDVSEQDFADHDM